MTTTTVSGARPGKSKMLGATRFFNKLVLPFAGTRLVPLYGVLRHRGRKSGKTFTTPVVVRPTGDGFVIPMPWGPGTDWYRNVQAAGAAEIRWKGRTYAVNQPEVLDAKAAGGYFGSRQRAGLERFGIKQVLRVRFAN